MGHALRYELCNQNVGPEMGNIKILDSFEQPA